MTIITSGISSIGKKSVSGLELLDALKHIKTAPCQRRSMSTSEFGQLLETKFYKNGTVVETTYMKTSHGNYERVNKQVFPNENGSLKFITSYFENIFRKTSAINTKKNFSVSFEKKNGIMTQDDTFM